MKNNILKRLTTFFIIVTILFVYHYLNSKEEAIELDLPIYVVASIKSSIVIIVVAMTIKILLSQNVIHTHLSYALFKSIKKAYTHQSGEIQLEYEDQNSLIYHFEKKGFKKRIEDGKRIIFSSTKFPNLLVDISPSKKGSIELAIYPYINLYWTESFPNYNLTEVTSQIS